VFETPQINKEHQQQLTLLRDLFRMTGALHEGQALQLRYWPRIAIGHSTHSEVHIRFTPGDDKLPRVVTVKAQVAGREPRNLKVGLAKLDEWIKFLLGEDFEVVVKYGTKTFRRPGKKPEHGSRTHQPREEEPRGTADARRARGVRAVPAQR
jgi:hypothetical protein